MLAIGSTQTYGTGFEVDMERHHYKVSQPLNSSLYNISYIYAGLKYLGRQMTLRDALRRAMEQAQGERGSSVLVTVEDTDQEAIDTCKALGLLPYDGVHTMFLYVQRNMPWQCGGVWQGQTSIGYAHIALGLWKRESVPLNLFLEATSYEDWQTRLAEHSSRK